MINISFFFFDGVKTHIKDNIYIVIGNPLSILVLYGLYINSDRKSIYLGLV